MNLSQPSLSCPHTVNCSDDFPPCPMNEQERPLLLIGWCSVVWLSRSNSVYMCIYRAAAVYGHQILFQCIHIKKYSL